MNCPSCGQEVKAGERFCGNCGAQVEMAAAPPPPEPVERAAPPPTPSPPPTAPPPPSRSRRNLWIVIIVVLVILCLCLVCAGVIVFSGVLQELMEVLQEGLQSMP
ncbi:MAG: zinc-ribbon domain-containing protein [Anaerolineae bacterium]